MGTINPMNNTDFLTYSKDELLNVIKELQKENLQLLENTKAEVAASQNMSFRQTHAEKILDALPDMLTVITDDGTTVAVVSSEDTNHSGFTREDIPGIPVRDFLPDHVYLHVMESIDQAIKYGKSENLSHVMYTTSKIELCASITTAICVCVET